MLTTNSLRFSPGARSRCIIVRYFHLTVAVLLRGILTPALDTAGLPPLSEAQSLKLRLLSLLTVASQKSASSPSETHLSYDSLCTYLSLPQSVDLEQLVTHAIYNDLITATLDPHHQIVVITSIAPLRDPAPGSVATMISELEAWSGRCDDVLASLEQEIAAVKAKAAARHKREMVVERQVKAVSEAAEKGPGGNMSQSRAGQNTRSAHKRDGAEDDDDADSMDIDGGNNGKKRGSTGGGPGVIGRLRGN